jgi:prepilin-type N-terminal cleavage/methylation domain-containing protein
VPVSRRLSDQRGFTLVELMIAIVIGSVVTLTAFTLLDRSVIQTGKTADRVDSTQRSRQAMEEITRQLRSQTCSPSGSPALENAGDYTITFWSFQGTGAFTPVRHTITWDPGAQQIVETDDSGAGTTITSRRVLLSDARVPGNVPLFSYFAYPSSGAVEPTRQLSTPLLAGDMGAVATIKVDFTAVAGTNANRQAGAPIPKEATALTSQVYARTSNPDDPNGPKGPVCS